ncbi:hypothetical protein EDD52_14115 [Primorskyibacter sedentarius]|uniref:Uncharacterized protein n=1 Tax=Primorskyibacter sedentarius TaxID=745311 RepID=A0A4R3INV9_9RHOB|nr:hypothetical protein EDD52_14115 [Primorskyibacter sedentarius]
MESTRAKAQLTPNQTVQFYTGNLTDLAPGLTSASRRQPSPSAGTCSGRWMCRNKWPHKPSGSTLPNRHTSRSRSRANGQASELSPNDVLKHLPIQRQVRDDLLQPTVLVFQCLQPAHLVGQQAGILLLPIEVRRLADPSLPADLGDRRASLALLQDEGLLRLRELRCFHAIPLLSQPGKYSGKLQPQTIQFSGGRAVTRPRSV